MTRDALIAQAQVQGREAGQRCSELRPCGDDDSRIFTRCLTGFARPG